MGFAQPSSLGERGQRILQRTSEIWGWEPTREGSDGRGAEYTNVKTRGPVQGKGGGGWSWGGSYISGVAHSLVETLCRPY